MPSRPIQFDLITMKNTKSSPSTKPAKRQLIQLKNGHRRQFRPGAFTACAFEAAKPKSGSPAYEA